MSSGALSVPMQTLLFHYYITDHPPTLCHMRLWCGNLGKLRLGDSSVSLVLSWGLGVWSQLEALLTCLPWVLLLSVASSLLSRSLHQADRLLYPMVQGAKSASSKRESGSCESLRAWTQKRTQHRCCHCHSSHRLYPHTRDQDRNPTFWQGGCQRIWGYLSCHRLWERSLSAQAAGSQHDGLQSEFIFPPSGLKSDGITICWRICEAIHLVIQGWRLFFIVGREGWIEELLQSV